jgi:hypothetical protein
MRSLFIGAIFVMSDRAEERVNGRILGPGFANTPTGGLAIAFYVRRSLLPFFGMGDREALRSQIALCWGAIALTRRLRQRFFERVIAFDVGDRFLGRAISFVWAICLYLKKISL